MAGAAFFISHSIVLSQGASSLIHGFNFWWHVGWLPLIAAPYAWYLLMLWYCGHWDDRHSPLHRKRGRWLWFSIVYTVLLAGLLLLANPLPSIARDAYIEVGRLPSLGGVPLITLAYPPYILFCIGLALEALLRPAPSSRVMGDLARRRARPWLISASLVLLLVSLMVGATILWLIQQARLRPAIDDLIYALSTTLSLMDLLLAGLLMAAVILLGQAIVSYEIFTGRTLPRKGFQVQWRNTILLAGAVCLVAAYGVTVQPAQVYTLLVITLLIALFSATFSWQSYSEREASMRQLRPFVTSQRMFESILTTPDSQQPDPDLGIPFKALCEEVLGTSRAALFPLGTLSAFDVSPLKYPPDNDYELSSLADLTGRFTSPEMTGLPLDPEHHEGMIWASPLWSERGLIGVFLLGEKRDGGFYSQEEIEIARASGERLLDIQATAELSRRLMSLQRQRLAESQVLDQQARRVLHDEVLPRLHALMLELRLQDNQTGIQALGELHRMVSNLLRELPAPTAPEIGRLGLVGALRQVVEVDLKGSYDQVSWQISPEAERCMQEIPRLSAEVLFYAAREALRNAARHARDANSPAELHLLIQADWQEDLKLVIEDNGGSYKLDSRGNGGQGLTLHSTLMAVVGGSLSIESTPGIATRVVLNMPAG
jgi:signal transduction histidine kinase